MKKLSYRTVASVLLAVACSSVWATTTVNIRPATALEGHVYQYGPAVTNDFMYVGNPTTNYNNSRAVIKISLSGVTAAVTSATLTVNGTWGNAGYLVLEHYNVSNGSALAVADWSAAVTRVGSVKTVPSAALYTFTWDVTSLVEADRQAGTYSSYRITRVKADGSAWSPTLVSGSTYVQDKFTLYSVDKSSTYAPTLSVTMAQASAPVFSPAGPYISGPTNIAMSSATPGASIYYTLNGGTPTTSSTPYTGAVAVNDGDVLRAIATATGYLASDVTSQTFEFKQMTLSTLQPPTTLEGFVNRYGDWIVTDTWIYVGNPNVNPHECRGIFKIPLNTLPATPVLQAALTVNTAALTQEGYFVLEHYNYDNSGALCLADWTTADVTRVGGVNHAPSGSVTAFTWDVTALVEADRQAGRYSAFRLVKTLANGTYWTSTLNGGVYGPDGLTFCSVDLFPTLGPTLSVSSNTPAAAPVFSPDGRYVAAGSSNILYISGSTNIAMSSATPGASIYYTLNGGTPTTSSTPYTAAVTVNDGDVLQAIAVADDYAVSAVTSRTYEVNPAGVDLTHGHNVLIKKGLQIQALIFPEKEDNWYVPTGFNLSQFSSANFTAPNLWQNSHGTSYLGSAPGVAWGRLTSTGQLGILEMPYLSTLMNLAYGDEQDVIDNLSSITTGINYVKQNYPHVLVYTNQFGDQQTAAEMQTYMAAAQPDVVMFDTYPFNGNVTGGSPTTYYGHVQKYRQLGLAGNDGTGTKPIPYALYTQTFTNSDWNNHIPSESEIRLNNYSAWAFGYKWVTAFTYDSALSTLALDPIMFDGIDDSTPTAKFTEVAETNRQSLNLGPALIRLLSTDVRMIMGLHGSGTVNTTPSGITTGISGADAYLTGVSATNLGTKNNGLRGDVIIGFFKPLHESFDGDTYSNQKYFMVTNGLSDGSGTASETQQKITLTFNMGTSGITSLQRLSRSTGTIEIVPLISDGGGLYHLDLVLDGGTGDLFKYNTGAPFVGVAQTETPILNVSPISQSLGSDAGTTTFSVNNGGTGTMTWTAEVTSGGEWLTITDGTSGSNAGIITVSFTENTSSLNDRTATILISASGAAGSPISVTVVQARKIILGDANLDGIVNFSDYLNFSTGFGSTGTPGTLWEQGDFNADGEVNFSDYLILSQNFGMGGSVSAEEVAKFQAASANSVADEESGMVKETAQTLPCTPLAMALMAVIGLALYGLGSSFRNER